MQGMGYITFEAETFGTVYLPNEYDGEQIAAIELAWMSGALSRAGLQTISNGQVAKDDVANFLASDPGQDAATLPPGPSPRVTVSATPATSTNTVSTAASTASLSNSLMSFFTGSTIISGVPNALVLLAPFALLMLFPSGGGRRR
jgi:hypothetical protein